MYGARGWRTASLLGCGFLVLSWSASAAWPVARGNAQRTGRVDDGRVGRLGEPSKKWRKYLGSSVEDGGILVEEGSPESVLYVAGGKLFRRTRDSAAVAVSGFGLTTLVGTADLDGDGASEVITRTLGQVVVFDQRGTRLWELAEGVVGTIRAVRVGDLDGDGLDDLAIQDCLCCEVRGSSNGVVYSFRGGYEQPELLWEIPAISCGAWFSTALVDVGNGAKAYLNHWHNNVNTLRLLSGASGEVLAETPVLGDLVRFSRCLPIQLDGAGAEEVVCVTNTQNAAPGLGNRVQVLRYDRAAIQPFDALWTRGVGDVSGAVTTPPGHVQDIDGDGSFEIAVTGQLADGTVVGELLDATSGALLVQLPGERMQGSVPLPDGTRMVLTSRGGVTSGWQCDTGRITDLRLAWSLTDRSPLSYWSHEKSLKSWFSEELVTADIDGDGEEDLVTLREYGGEEVIAYSLTNTQLREIGRYVLPQGTSLSKVAPAPSGNSVADGLLVLRSDGVMEVLGSGLHPAPLDADQTVTFTFRVGGFYAPGTGDALGASPVLGARDGGLRDSVLVTDSRGALLSLDASSASMLTPPRLEWERERTFSATMLPDGRTTAFSANQPVTDPPTYSVVLLRNNGSEAWRTPLPGAPFRDVMFGVTDTGWQIFAQWGLSTDNLTHTWAIDSASGLVSWDNAPVDVQNVRSYGGLAVLNWDGDGVDDLVHYRYGARVISGLLGDEVARGGDPNAAYYTPIVCDLDQDPASELIFNASGAVAFAVDDDMATEVWRAEGPDRAYPWGAVANCDQGRSVLIQGSWQYPSRVGLVDLGASVVSHHVLAGGERYVSADEAAAAGVRQGQLSSPSVHANLTGVGRDVAVLGSSDGWLYGLDPCSSELVFSLDMGWPVGEPVFGDTDGDGWDEIIVTAADGYLYAIDDPGVSAPSAVWDVDPLDPGAGDVDTVETTDSLYLGWLGVGGADEYEVSVACDGQILTEPPWLPVGATEYAEVSGLVLQDGQFCQAGVRAVVDGERSHETLSDGVLIFASGGGGNAGAGPTSGTSGAAGAGGGGGPSGGTSGTAGAAVGGVGGVAGRFGVAGTGDGGRAGASGEVPPPPAGAGGLVDHATGGLNSGVAGLLGAVAGGPAGRGGAENGGDAAGAGGRQVATGGGHQGGAGATTTVGGTPGRRDRRNGATVEGGGCSCRAGQSSTWKDSWLLTLIAILGVRRLRKPAVDPHLRRVPRLRRIVGSRSQASRARGRARGCAP